MHVHSVIDILMKPNNAMARNETYHYCDQHRKTMLTMTQMKLKVFVANRIVCDGMEGNEARV